MFALPAGEFSLEVLSPVHIGTGETLEPLEYVVGAGDVHEYEVAIYDLPEAIRRMSSENKTRLEELIRFDKYVKLRGWLSARLWDDPESQPAAVRIVAADAELNRTYEAELDQVRSALEIHPLMTQPISKRPLIPGSSIKGSLRTAWLNHLCRERGVGQHRYSPRDFEKELLGDPRHDPFRLLAVGDVELPAQALNVSRVFNVRQGSELVSTARSGDKTFRMYFEFIQPDTEREPVSGCGRLTWSDPETSSGRGRDRAAPTLLSRKLKNAPQSLQDVLDAATKDAQRELEREVAFFGGGTAAGVLAGRLLKLLPTVKPGETLLKLGRFGGVFSKTVEEVRKPRTRKGKDGRQLPWGKTRFVTHAMKLPEANEPSKPVAGLVSCGWCRLRVHSAQE